MREVISLPGKPVQLHNGIPVISNEVIRCHGYDHLGYTLNTLGVRESVFE